MKKLLLIALLIVGCSTEPETVHGCLDSQAYNYDLTATIDNNSCTYIDSCGKVDDDKTNDCSQDECGVWGGNGSDNNNSCIYNDEIIQYANQHWDFGRWIKNYYNWYDHKENNSEWNALRGLFINDSDSTSGCAQDPTLGQCYVDIWDYSSRIKFTYNGQVVSSSSVDFKEIFKDLCGNNNSWDTFCSNGSIDLKDDNNDSILITKDFIFYENIAKYNSFIAGWDDIDSIYITNDNLGMTPNKLFYRKLMNLD